MKWGAADPGMDYLIQVGRQGVGVGEAEHIPEGRQKGQREGSRLGQEGENQHRVGRKE